MKFRIFHDAKFSVGIPVLGFKLYGCGASIRQDAPNRNDSVFAVSVI